MIYRWNLNVEGKKPANHVWYVPNGYKRLIITAKNSNAADNQNVIVREMLGTQQISTANIPMTTAGVILFNGGPRGSHLELQLTGGISASPASVYFDFWGED